MASTKIYTKTGDKGTTALVGGKRISKSDLRLDAYGTVDELNSQIGVLCSLLESYAFQGAERFLKKTQNNLFNVGSQLACDDAEMAKMLPPITDEHILAVEKEIDEMTKDLPELKTFILPGGSPLAAQAHVARTVCRRAERYCCRITDITASAEMVIPYINRLSDYFFILARFFNRNLGVDDTQWEK
ncbi:MAG: cob(I)yrinic acid a,c-diamide adenosyltransferase [Bdellovibrionaceae bacterium]|nr:cob(I)yrinic acid a,c-diamide adenosyltransferase [Pseudobdellovibrionaceae bacterium]